MNKHIGLADFSDTRVVENLKRIYGDSFQKSVMENIPTEVVQQEASNYLDTINKAFKSEKLTEKEAENAALYLDSVIKKARNVKYYKREGTPGNYKYYYTKEQYENKKGGKKDSEKKEEKGKEEYSAEDISNYIDENINLTPNSNWTIYQTPDGLKHTKGSMEFRDKNYSQIMSFMTMDEIPETKEDLLNNVEYQMNR